MNIVGATAQDSLYPGALLRLTFGKAYFFHTSDQFANESRVVYDNLSDVAHLYPQQGFPLADQAITWTVDARTQSLTNGAPRTVAEVSQAIRAACDRVGVDVVELETIEVLTTDKVKTSTAATGATQRAGADTAGAASASQNPGAAVTDAAKKFFDQLSTAGKWITGGIVVLIIVWFLLNRKR